MSKQLQLLKRGTLLSVLSFFLFQTVKAQFSCTGFNVTNISYGGNNAQNFVVPAGTTQLRISLTGASGGLASASTNSAGGGATVYAYVNVVAGDVFRVLIGQKGIDGINEAGGGGSSAVYKNGVLIMVAGAGGGEDNTGDGGNGLAAVNGGNGGDDSGAGGSGGCGSSVNNGRGGTGGNGGNHGEFSANCPHGGGGGGGLNSAGQGNGNINSGQPGARGNVNGAAGGTGSADDAVGINGGWGWSGGGGADDRESGGGGGYSGGGGGPESRNPGGGGSFVAAIGTNGITASGKSDGTGTTTGYNGSAIVCSPLLIVLPVKFQSFTAQQAPQAVSLKWVVSSQVNTAYYRVEKSTDGVHFSSIGTVYPQGNADGMYEYQFADNTIGNGRQFYRIKAVDNDATYGYSETRTVELVNQRTGLIVSVQPADNNISVTLPADWAGKSEITVTGFDGRLILKKTVNQTRNELNLRGLSKGVYFIRAFNAGNNKQLAAKFIK